MKNYTKEFKKMACEMVKCRQNSPTIVAKELQIPLKTYEKWLHVFRSDDQIFNPGYETLEQENKRLKYMLKRQRETIDILKKAKAFSLTEKPLLKIS